MHTLTIRSEICYIFINICNRNRNNSNINKLTDISNDVATRLQQIYLNYFIFSLSFLKFEINIIF